MNPRTLAFISIGTVGFLVQITVLAVLSLSAHVPVAIATPLAVEAAVLTNFFAHERWTWHDRSDPVSAWSRTLSKERARRFLRFHVANGMTSVAGNTVMTAFLTSRLRLSAITANLVAVGLLSVLNYLAADRWVFVKRAATVAAAHNSRSRRHGGSVTVRLKPDTTY